MIRAAWSWFWVRFVVFLVPLLVVFVGPMAVLGLWPGFVFALKLALVAWWVTLVVCLAVALAQGRKEKSS